jgi:NADPH-dependent ferric siderophore reductase
MNEGPRVERVRHELKRRKLTVARVERLPPRMVRIVLTGEELRGFWSPGFDDHVKLFFPIADRTGTTAITSDPSIPAPVGGAAGAMRDFTPRRFDAETGELWIDFFLHEGGPAAAWAAQARAGQFLEIGGPKGSAVVAADGIDAHVLIGDETALPAINRRLEELPSSARTLVVVELDAGAERPLLVNRAAMDVAWVARNEDGGPPAHEIIAALRKLTFPPGRCYVWIAAESRSARAIRGHLCGERRLDRKWIKAAGYWQRGSAGTHDRIPEDT